MQTAVKTKSFKFGFCSGLATVFVLVALTYPWCYQSDLKAPEVEPHLVPIDSITTSSNSGIIKRSTRAIANKIAIVTTTAISNVEDSPPRNIVTTKTTRPVGLPDSKAYKDLWKHLQLFVLDHRTRLGPVGSLKVVIGSGQEEPTEKVSAAWKETFLELAIPEGADVGIWAPAKTTVYIGGACNTTGVLPELWSNVLPGSVLIIPVCSEKEYEEAYTLLYSVNCKQMYFNHVCGKNSSTAVTHGGVKLRCGDFPLDSVYRVGFVNGFIIIERRDEKESLDKLGTGDFTDLAKDIGQLISDRLTKSAYNQLYERYLARTRASEGFMLQMSLGCNIASGPDSSAILWRRYFPKRRIEFMEVDSKCAKRWAKACEHLNFLVHLGDQEHILQDIVQEIRSFRRPGFRMVVHDALQAKMHSNAWMKFFYGILWPLILRDGFYVFEDIAAPAFSKFDCEPLDDVRQKQNSTALAMLLELSKSLVLGVGPTEIQRLECSRNICIVQKA